MRDVYGFELSESTISRITDRVANDVIAWQNRPLDSVYLIVWMDGIVFKVRENSNIKSNKNDSFIYFQKRIFRFAGFRLSMRSSYDHPG